MESYGKGIPEVQEETFQVIDVLVILIVMIVFWMYMFAETYQNCTL